MSVTKSEELEAFQLLNCGPEDVDRGVLPLLVPEVHNQLLSFVEGEVTWYHTPSPDLLPVGCLIVVGNQA